MKKKAARILTTESCIRIIRKKRRPLTADGRPFHIEWVRGPRGQVARLVYDGE